jgi:hypothetical protein
MNAFSIRIGILMLVVYGLMSLVKLMYKDFFMLLSP